VIASPFGGYIVAANHAFSAGTTNVTVTIKDAGGSTATVTETVVVNDAPITAKGIDFTQVEGQPYKNFFVKFVDADTRPHSGTFYLATIHWGDTKFDAEMGKDVPDVTTGTVIPDGRGGYLVFDKSQTLHFGTYHVNVTITDTVDGVVGGVGGEGAVTAAATLTANDHRRTYHRAGRREHRTNRRRSLHRPGRDLHESRRERDGHSVQRDHRLG